MITELSKPELIASEYAEDYQRATYWVRREIAKIPRQKVWPPCMPKLMMTYESPKTGNKWMAWSHGEKVGVVCYRLLAEYMSYMTSTCFTKGDVEHDVECISIYTSHLFQRMHQRMGLDVSDRLAVIRNFATVLEGASIQINEPRNGRKHHEVCALLGDAAILVGGLYECKDKRKLIVYYKSFLPVKALTPQQRRFYKELLSKK